MPDFFKLGDGTDRSFRPVQTEILGWLDQTWRAPRVVGQFPVATGKSMIARAVQNLTGAHIITPANVLIDQYTDTYPDVNFLKGKTHYNCSTSLMTCYDWQDGAGMKACHGCPYAACRDISRHSPTFFNPMSYYYSTLQGGWQRPHTLIVDEAHQLVPMMLMMAGTRFRHSEYRFDDRCLNERYLVAWLDGNLERLRKLQGIYAKSTNAADLTRLIDIKQEAAKLRMVRDGFYENAQNYAIWLDKGTYRGRPERFLNLKPLRPPKYIRDKLLDAHKLILMSGTMFEHDIRDLVGDEPYEFLDVDSPIPKERRPVFYEPAPFKVNYETDPKLLADVIRSVVDRERRLLGFSPNTLVHVSYAWAARLKQFLPDNWLFNTAESKPNTIDDFKRRGGVFVAAGCAEGLDLKGDLCRLNIIPHLLFPSMADEVVKKRMALADGKDWYALETMKAVIQQTGRSTRDPGDWSKTIILDGNFGRTYQRVKTKLPKSFKDSIQWSATGNYTWPPP